MNVITASTDERILSIHLSGRDRHGWWLTGTTRWGST